jgi:hypothetical protein
LGEVDGWRDYLLGDMGSGFGEWEGDGGKGDWRGTVDGRLMDEWMLRYLLDKAKG